MCQWFCDTPGKNKLGLLPMNKVAGRSYNN